MLFVTALDSKKGVGALAHVMLPGRSPKEPDTRYGADAIDMMINKITCLGSNIKDVEVSLIGGANILKRNDDTIGEDNIKSVIDILNKKKYKNKN